MENKQSLHIGWIDVLRIMACFLVVMAHACDPFVAQFDNNRPEMLSGVFWGSLVRPCVPLFVMMTGVLLLPINTDMRSFYSKRISRIVIPLIFWSMLFPIIYYFYVNYGGESASPNIVVEEHSLSAALTKLYTFIFNFSYSVIPLWYLYMLVGLYLIIPIINPWLLSATKKEMKTFLILWVISMTLPYIQIAAPFLGYIGNYGNMGLLGVCDWNPYGTFYYMSGFLGYMVLAYYLKKYPLQWSWKKTLSIVSPLFLIGYSITLIGFLFIQKYFPTDYAWLEIFWYFSGINVFMMTFSVFVVMSKFKIKENPVVAKIASLTFGIYLCHYFVVQVVYDFIHPFDSIIPPYIMIPLIAFLAFVVTGCFVWILKQFSLTKRLVS